MWNGKGDGFLDLADDSGIFKTLPGTGRLAPMETTPVSRAC
jgi:hypothetical protein